MARNPRPSNRGGVNPSAGPRPAGQVRRSQLLNTFGPGALIDLPKHSVLVGGLDHWRGTGANLDEPRLLQKIRRFLPDVQELREPPLDPDSQNPTTGVTVWQFPEWFITQDFIKSRARRLVHRSAVRNGQVEDEDDKKQVTTQHSFESRFSFPRSSVTAIKLSASCSVTMFFLSAMEIE